MARKPVIIPLPKQIAIADVLRQHCRAVDNRSVYEDGWNDNRIGETVDAPPWAVRNIRVALMGLLLREEPGEAGGAALANLESRVTGLERLRGDFEARIAAMTSMEGRIAGLERLRTDLDAKIAALEHWRIDTERRRPANYGPPQAV